jgi:hypothetical protein
MRLSYLTKRSNRSTAVGRCFAPQLGTRHAQKTRSLLILPSLLTMTDSAGDKELEAAVSAKLDPNGALIDVNELQSTITRQLDAANTPEERKKLELAVFKALTKVASDAVPFGSWYVHDALPPPPLSHKQIYFFANAFISSQLSPAP